LQSYSDSFLDVQDSQRLPGMVNWGPATVIAVFAGMLYGGSREASSSVVSLSSNAPKLCFNTNLARYTVIFLILCLVWLGLLTCGYDVKFNTRFMASQLYDF
jgi:hypothetical protein